jgi:hypothetical protein
MQSSIDTWIFREIRLPSRGSWRGYGISEYKASRDERAREIEEILRGRLAAMGISGSAVQPSLEGKREWIEAREGFQKDFGNRLEALKEELRNS